MSSVGLTESASLLPREARQTNDGGALNKAKVVCWTASIFNILTLALGISKYHGKTHPFSMILSFSIMTLGMLNYRMPSFSLSERALQRVHYMLMLLVVILTSVGVYSAVAKQHKNPLPIIHAVLGWTTMVFFSLQLLLGGGAISMVRLNPNHGLIQLHRIVGPSVQAAFTAALIDGILLKCRDVYCLVLVASVALTTIFSAFCIVSSE
jgi:hypothetical protein